MKNFILKVVAITTFCLGAVLFALECITPMPWYHPDAIVSLQWTVALSFIIANLAVTALAWLKQSKSEGFQLDDLAFCSAITMGQGAALGVLILFITACELVIPEPLAVAIQHPTLGMVALGFIGMAVFFALHCMGAISYKKWWFAVQAGSLSLIMIAIVLGCGSRFYIVPLSLEASEAWGWVAIAGLATALFSYFMQSRK